MIQPSVPSSPVKENFFNPAVMQAKLKQVVSTAVKIISFAIALIYDILMLPAAGVFLLVSLVKKNFDPKDSEIKKDKTPILLLHGSNSCQAYWALLRLALKGKEFGSVFSCNYTDGLIYNDPKKGIDAYMDRISEVAKNIQNKTGRSDLICVGHSMGGLVGELYAQNAKKDGIVVTDVITIASPLQGSPTIDFFGMNAKRFQQMSKTSGSVENRKFREDFVDAALKAEDAGERRHWNIWGKHDIGVPGRTGCMTRVAERQREIGLVGHYSVLFDPRVLNTTSRWIKKIYQLQTPATA